MLYRGNRPPFKTRATQPTPIGHAAPLPLLSVFDNLATTTQFQAALLCCCPDQAVPGGLTTRPCYQVPGATLRNKMTVAAGMAEVTATGRDTIAAMMMVELRRVPQWPR